MKMLKIALGASLAMAAMAAVPASATVCATTDIVPNAQACTGFFAGNLLSGSPADIAAQTSALATLGFTWDGNFAADENISGLAGSHTLDFATLLQGITYIGIHFGNGVGGPTDSTAFYKIDAGAGLDTITLNYNASSTAVLYSTVSAVPEPATWAMMLLGFGAVGYSMRKRKVGYQMTQAA